MYYDRCDFASGALLPELSGLRVVGLQGFGVALKPQGVGGGRDGVARGRSPSLPSSSFCAGGVPKCEVVSRLARIKVI